MFKNVTTWEMLGRENITYLSNMSDNPFDEGQIRIAPLPTMGQAVLWGLTDVQSREDVALHLFEIEPGCSLPAVPALSLYGMQVVAPQRPAETGPPFSGTYTVQWDVTSEEATPPTCPHRRCIRTDHREFRCD